MGTSFFLPANLPLGVAAELMLTGRMLGCQRALQLGLVRVLLTVIVCVHTPLVSLAILCHGCGPPTRSNPTQQYSSVLPDLDAAMRACRSLAADMLSCSPMGLVLTKQQLNAVADGMSLSAALTAENSHQMLLVNNPEAAKVGFSVRNHGFCCTYVCSTTLCIVQIAKAWVAKLMGDARAKL